MCGLGYINFPTCDRDLKENWFLLFSNLNTLGDFKRIGFFVQVFLLNTQHTHSGTYAAHLPVAHAGGVLYGTELGTVTLKRVGLF
jgi:hypothetical protein